VRLKDVHRLIGQRRASRLLDLRLLRARRVLRGQRRRHDLVLAAILVSARPCDVLIVIGTKVFLTDWALRHHRRVLQVLYHLVLRARLHFEGTDATLAFQELAIELDPLLLKSVNFLFHVVVLAAHLVNLLLERRDLLFAQAE